MSFINIGQAYLEGTEVANQYRRGVGAAGEIKQEGMQFAGRERSISGQVAQSQYASTVGGVGFATNMELRKTQAFGDQSYAQSNLATSGTIEQQVGTQTRTLWEKYQTDTKKAYEMRKLAQEQGQLAYEKTESNLEQQMQETIAGLEEGGGAAYAWDETLNQINEREQMAQKMATG